MQVNKEGELSFEGSTEGRRMVHYGNKHSIDGWCCKSLKQNLKQIASQAIYP